MSMPKKLLAWAEQPGAVLSDSDREFAEAVDRLSRRGVGFGFMQQVCEWAWQEYCERMGLPAGAWGPESHAAEVASHRRLVEAVRAMSRDGHVHGSRPCVSCAAVTAAIGEPFGCDELRRKIRSTGPGPGRE